MRRVSGAGAGLEPANKKLRSSDPDLKINVKERDDAGNVANEKDYPVYSQVFARYSRFVDTTLSVNMKEKDSREIIFQMSQIIDITEDTFDLLVEAIATADKFNLEDATELGVAIVDSIWNQIVFDFSEDHIRQLQPLLIRHEAKFNLKQSMKMTQEELESTLFPKYCVDFQSKADIQTAIDVLIVSGTGTEVDGVYKRRLDGRLGESEYAGGTNVTWRGRSVAVWVSRTPFVSGRKNWKIVAWPIQWGGL